MTKEQYEMLNENFEETQKGAILTHILNARLIAISPYLSPYYEDEEPTLEKFIENSPKLNQTMDLIRQNKKDIPNSGQIIYSELAVSEFPKLKEYFPIVNSVSMPSADYLLVSKEKYYNDGGMLMVNLDEFTVNADARKTKASETRFYSGMADNEFTAEKLEQYPGYSIFDILSMTPGVVVSGETISIRGSQGNPLFMVDGIETDRIEDISYLNSSDIENISVFKGANTAIFGSKGGNGVVAIELKKGVVRQAQTPPSLAHIMPLGFQKPAEFYVPKYEVDSIRNLSRSDLRTTIYWNPSVVTDASGNCQLKFYTADRANQYNVELEGIGPKGEICRFSAVIRRED